jgi:hypothetical protein
MMKEPLMLKKLRRLPFQNHFLSFPREGPFGLCSTAASRYQKSYRASASERICFFMLSRT